MYTHIKTVHFSTCARTVDRFGFVDEFYAGGATVIAFIADEHLMRKYIMQQEGYSELVLLKMTNDLDVFITITLLE